MTTLIAASMPLLRVGLTDQVAGLAVQLRPWALLRWAAQNTSNPQLSAFIDRAIPISSRSANRRAQSATHAGS